MFPSLAQTAALLLASTALTAAFDEILAPSTITADVSAQIQLTASSFDLQFDQYRVYLATTPPGWGTGPACYLVNSSSTSILDFNVAIPASVGPSGSDYYSIAVMLFNTDPNADASASGFQYSSNFDFQGGTGEWSTYETTGYSVSDADTLPCSAYDCARNCSQTYYPANVADTADETTYKATYECIGRCPNVVQPSWDDLVGGTVTTAGGGSSITSTTASTRAATQTSSGATASGTGAAVQSTISTSSSRTSSATTGSNTASAVSTSATSTSTNAGVPIKAGGMLAFVAGAFALVL